MGPWVLDRQLDPKVRSDLKDRLDPKVRSGQLGLLQWDRLDRWRLLQWARLDL